MRQFKVSQPLLESGRGNLSGASYPLKQSVCSLHLSTFLFYMLRHFEIFLVPFWQSTKMAFLVPLTQALLC